MSGLLDSIGALSPTARKVGEVTARKLFNARGNNSEVHLNEFELAAAIATGIETALRLRDGARAAAAHRDRQEQRA